MPADSVSVVRCLRSQCAFAQAPFFWRVVSTSSSRNWASFRRCFSLPTPAEDDADDFLDGAKLFAADVVDLAGVERVSEAPERARYRLLSPST